MKLQRIKKAVETSVITLAWEENSIVNNQTKPMTEITRKDEAIIAALKKAFEISVFETTGVRIFASYLLEQEQTYKHTTMPFILKLVAFHFGVNELDMLSRTRVSKIVEARQSAMYIIRDELNEPLHSVGRFMNKDHSTIIHGCRSIARQVEVDNELRGKIEKVKADILASKGENFNNKK